MHQESIEHHVRYAHPDKVGGEGGGDGEPPATTDEGAAEGDEGAASPAPVNDEGRGG